jgi:hypothetical protein
MKGDEKEKRDKGIYKRMGGSSAKLTPKGIVLYSSPRCFQWGNRDVL